MRHFGTLRDYKFADNAADIRGAAIFGKDNEKLGEVSDVIFDHDSGDVRYVVVETGGWLKSKQFLVPAGRFELSQAEDADESCYTINLSKNQIEAFPAYDEKLLATEKDWNDYEKKFAGHRSDGPVLHQENSAHIVTPADLPPSDHPTRGSVDAAPHHTGTVPP